MHWHEQRLSKLSTERTHQAKPYQRLFGSIDIRMQNGKHLQQNKQAYIFFLLSLAVGWNYLFHLYLLIGLKKKSVFCLLLSAQSNVYCPGYRDISFFLLIIESVKAVLKNCVPSPQMTQPHILSWRKTTRC